jgi:carboxylesterase type B
MFQFKIGNLASRLVCEQFSVETIYRLGTLGWHAIHKYMSEKQVNDIINQYDNVL